MADVDLKLQRLNLSNYELQERLGNIEGVERRRIITKHIESFNEEENVVTIDEFPKDLEWINTKENISMKSQLKGKIVILDFFTYCCINCMHILPDLHKLEEEFSIQDGVIVIGIHSAKFENEKSSANILSAVLRYSITHPVLNDYDAILWNKYQIQCWPTLLVLGPNNQALASLIGEGHGSFLREFVGVALDYYKTRDQISDHSIAIEPYMMPASPLKFPGRVCVSSNGAKLAISDTGHHRIIVADKHGVVEKCIGGTGAGFQDGDFATALFNSPQGVVWCGDSIYVADTNNHAIRQINLFDGRVTTVCGTGLQGTDKEGGKIGCDQAISSPWGIARGPSQDVLYIAMAGSHQIWVLFLRDCKWLKNKMYSKHTCIRFAGSGQEENRNNSYPHKASFAQPSGIAIDSERQLLYVADSESSSVRQVSLKDGRVKALIGGGRDPTNLFAYGDRDGKALDVRLQHPLDVAVLSDVSGEILVADSYNHKIKKIDPSSRECSSYIGNGRAGNTVGSVLSEVQLNEPGGLCVDDSSGLIYIADTNNHSIKVADVKNGTIAEMPIIFPNKLDQVDTSTSKRFKRITPKSAQVITFDPLPVEVGQPVTLNFKIILPDGNYYTEDAPSAWQILTEDDTFHCPRFHTAELRGPLGNDISIPPLTCEVPTQSGEPLEVRVEVMLYYCDPAGVCRMKGVILSQPMKINSSKNTSHVISSTLTYRL